MYRLANLPTSVNLRIPYKQVNHAIIHSYYDSQWIFFKRKFHFIKSSEFNCNLTQIILL